jgi:hypothetical protein
LKNCAKGIGSVRTYGIFKFLLQVLLFLLSDIY